MSPTPDEIRKDVDKVIGLVKQIVDVAQSGDKLGLVLRVASVLPDLMITGGSFNKATSQEKTDYALEGFDALVGTETTAIVSHIGPLSPESTEKVTDALKAALREIFAAKFNTATV